MGRTNFGTCGLGCSSSPLLLLGTVPTERCPPPVARETRRIGGSLPIAVTNAFVKSFLNGMDRGMGDENGKRRLLALQPAIERNVAASRSNLDFYSTLLVCQAPQVSPHVHVSEALQYLETVGDHFLPLLYFFIMVTECGLKYCSVLCSHQNKYKFVRDERIFEGLD